MKKIVKIEKKYLKFQQPSNTLRDVYCRGNLFYISHLAHTLYYVAKILSVPLYT